MDRVHVLCAIFRQMDLTNNGMIVDYFGTSPLGAGSFDAPSIGALIKQGSNNNAWTGNGITSSTAAAVAADSNNPHKTALGYAEASALGITSFMGQTVDTTAVLVRYTYLGDANLDGAVNQLDFNALATNYGANGANAAWNAADFNADGVVDSTDFNVLAGNFNLALPAPALAALVPEPGALFVLASICALASRRRRRERG